MDVAIVAKNEQRKGNDFSYQWGRYDIDDLLTTKECTVTYGPVNQMENSRLLKFKFRDCKRVN